MSTSKQRPIGVFDSGVGGLTNVRALMERLPMENIIYFGDTARVPYGTKSRATIETFAMQIVDFLLENDVKALVIACNTIAAVAGQKIRQKAGNMPVLDVISAGAQAALNTTRNNKIGIIATNTTLARDGLAPGDAHLAGEAGGLSGRPLTPRALDFVERLAGSTHLPVIGAGGIMSPRDGARMFEAGATLLQLYTGFIYEGPALVRALNRSAS